MYRANTTNKYEISGDTARSAKRWEEENMYKTSYDKHSETNVYYNLI